MELLEIFSQNVYYLENKCTVLMRVLFQRSEASICASRMLTSWPRRTVL